ncbi:MAG TPA: malonyl-CoA synthase [Geminicoccaceae bacterium]|nr:malonyl-CoA synthase [Geminicoccaceae bacterium]
MSENLFSLISGRISDPARTFVTTLDGASLSYGDTMERAGRYAAALASLGVEPGDRVAVQVDKSPEVLMLYLGCLRAGAAYLPLNTAYTEAEIGYFLGDAEPKVAVCRPGSREAFERLAGQAKVQHVATLAADGSGSIAERARSSSGGFGIADRRKDDLAAILYTSGTTGRSKGAMLTHGNLASNAESLVEIWRFSPDDVLLHALPIFHTHGLFVATNVALMTGSRMIFLPGFELEAVLRSLPESTVMMGVPTFYSRLLSDPRFTRELVAHMRLFISGSAPLSPELHKEFEARTGHAILERYGMTETNMNTSNPYDGPRRPGTVGFPLPGVEIRIAEPETGRPLPQGEVGVIEIRGPNVFKGYWQMPEKTEAEFRDDGFFISGDLGMIDEQGYLNIVGRDKDLVISGGYNVYPAEVEATLDALPEIAESAVIGLPHPDFGEGVVAAVVLRQGQRTTEKEVRARLERQLAKYKVPKRVFFVDDLPKNAMGKVQKNVLRDTYKKTFA